MEKETKHLPAIYQVSLINRLISTESLAAVLDISPISLDNSSSFPPVHTVKFGHSTVFAPVEKALQ